MQDKIGTPRPQHYHFAHRFLRDYAHSFLQPTLEMLRKEIGSNYLRTHWAIQGLASKGVDDEFIPADELTCYPFDVDDNCAGVIVAFPRPERLTEAWFVAIVAGGVNPKFAESPYLRGYFILEYGADGFGNERTVLCAWRGDTHINYGDGPPPAIADFLQAVLSLIDGKKF